ncbi:MAG: EAL domain-containing protein, partial [Clostridia bacterium]|nr:EAL domain-containing protein [Clostridia bacterium]
IKAVIKLFESVGLRTLLCAPTGKAAKRMTEVTGADAYTVHRLLGAKIAEFERSEGGAAGYLGQDDYCVFVPYDEEKIKKLHWELSRIIVAHGSSFGFIPVFGVCIAEDRVTVPELYDRATIAQNNAKTNFQNRISLFNSSMYDQTDNEYRILSDFRDGIQSHEFFFVLQPQCRASTGKILGAESLARWRRADGSIVSPGVFVPVLEKYGFITVLDKYIWEEVCIWLRKWIDSGHDPLPVSVNVSQIDIFNMDIADFFEALVEKYHLSNDMIKIEITESAYVENGRIVKDTVSKLREKGFLVLMDDFGSGYSSLNMLRNLNVDIIKLDAQFLTTGDSDTVKGIHIIEAIVNMVKTLELPIIVEGVEHKEQRQFLEDLGCRYVQGYYFYRPMPVDSFEKLISDQQNVDYRGIIHKHNEQFRIIDFLDDNVYSDTMLNNILGAVCIYGWHGDSVDVVRYNEQFYKLVDMPDFAERLTDIQRFMPENGRRKLFCAMKKAMKDRLNGSISETAFIKSDGTPALYNVHFSYLGDTDGEKRFYCSVNDVTEVTELQNQMKLLSRFSSESVVFISNADRLARFNVAVYGLGGRLGIEQEDFEREMNDGSFLDRVDETSANRLNAIIDAQPGTGAYSFPINYTTPSGEVVKLVIKVDPVYETGTETDYILIIREKV